MSLTRKVMAYLVAVALISIAASLSLFTHFAFDTGLPNWTGNDVVVSIGLMALIMVPFVAVAGMVLGLPVAKLLSLGDVRGAPYYALAGAIAGGLSSLLVLGLIFPIRVAAFTVGIVPGLLGGIYWWMVVDRHQNQNSGTYSR